MLQKNKQPPHQQVLKLLFLERQEMVRNNGRLAYALASTTYRAVRYYYLDFTTGTKFGNKLNMSGARVCVCVCSEAIGTMCIS